MIYQNELISETYSAKLALDFVEQSSICGFRVLNSLGLRIKYYILYILVFFVQKSDIPTHGRKLIKEGTIGLKSSRGQVTGKMRIPLIFS